MRTETVNCISYREIEQLVREHYTIFEDYEFNNVQQSRNDPVYRYNLNAAWDGFDAKDWKEIIANKTIDNNYLLMKKLCFDGHLPKGIYIVEVSW